MKPKEVERDDIFLGTAATAQDCAFVYCCVLGEDVAHRGLDEREEFALKVGDCFRNLPGLIKFCRIGMYEFLGQAVAKRALLLAWTHERSALQDEEQVLVRWGLAFRLLTSEQIESLLVGTSESARGYPGSFIFELGPDDWVRPI